MSIAFVAGIEGGVDTVFDVSALPRTQDHVLIIFMEGSIADPPTPPTGWIEFDVSPRQSSSHITPAMYGFYKILGASEPTSYDFGGVDGYAVNFLEYSGVDTADPIAATSAADNGNATPMLTLPAVTAEHTGAMLVIGETNQINLIPTVEGFNTRVDGFFMFSFDKLVNVGSTGDVDVVSANEFGTGWDIGFLIALNPIIGPGQRFDCSTVDSQIN